MVLVLFLCEHSSSSRGIKVLAQRNPAVVSVGAWVEVEHAPQENPAALALLTEEIQTQRRRENEENLRRFQQEVRHRVAQQAQLTRRRHLHTEVLNQREQVWTQHVFAGETLLPSGSAAHHNLGDSDYHETGEDMKQVRLRLAACRVSPSEEMMSELPREKQNTSSSKHKLDSCMNEEDEDEEEDGDDRPLTNHHECLLVKQKLPGRMLWDSKTHSKVESDPGFQSCTSSPRVLWPLIDPEEELKKQRQSRFLMHRRLCMNVERRQVKENQQHKKHIKKTASIKAEKERARLEEERRMERDLQVAHERRRLREREQLILERLRLREEEKRAAELQRRKQEKEKVDARFVEALKAQLKERVSQVKMELPPLCLCAPSFWDAHPETCANNCVFHNNPKAYAKALQSTMLSFGLH